MTDSLSEVDANNSIVRCLERQSVVRHITPQIFSAKKLRFAYNQLQSHKICTDEAQAFCETGGQVQVVLAQQESLKVTTEADIGLIEDIENLC